MRYRPIQAALRERVPFSLWGSTRKRKVLAAVAASAVALVPAVMIGSPAQAVPISNLTVSNATTWEGGLASFTVTYTGSGPSALVTFSTDVTGAGAGHAIGGGDDFTSAPGLASYTFPGTIAGGTNTVTVTVATTGGNGGDATLAEGNETFLLRATDAGGAITEGTGTIVEATTANDITLTGATTVSEAPVVSGSGTTPRTVRVTATQTYPQPYDVVIPVKTADSARGTNYTDLRANSVNGVNRDYTALPVDAAIVIKANESTGYIDVTIWDDAVDESPTQYFDVELDTARNTLGGDVLGTEDEVEIAITDDDAAPVVTIANAADAVEGSRLTFPVTATNGSELGIAVTFATASGTDTDTSMAATRITDFAATADGTVTIPAYGRAVNVMVSTVGADGVEGPENMTATISAPTNGATLGTPATATGVITDGDAAPKVWLDTDTTTVVPVDLTGANAEHTFAELNSGTADKTIKVSLSANTSAIPVKVDYKFVDVTATNGVDYQGTSGSITIPAGQATTAEALIPVKILGDAIDENPSETFKVVLSSPNNSINAESVAGDHVFTITDDDAAPMWTVGDVQIAEGNTGVTTARIPVTLLAPTTSDAIFTATTPFGAGGATETGVNSGTTVGDNDYDLPTVRTATVKAGTTTGYFDIPINADTIHERDEAFSVTFTGGSNVDNSTPAEVSHVSRVTITNDDAAPVVTFNEMAGTEGMSVRVTGTTTGLSQYEYKLGLAFAPTGTSPATAAVDYEVPTNALTTYTVPRGTQGAFTTTIADVYLSPDDIDEPVQTFGITATETTPSPIGIIASTGVYRINDDPADLPPSVAIRDESIKEDEASVDVRVDLTPTGDTLKTEQTISIPYASYDGSAKSGADYTYTKGTLTIEPGATTKSINVPITNDKIAEGAENFWVKLGTASPSGTVISKSAGEVTIVANDGGTGSTPGGEEPGGEEPGGEEPGGEEPGGLTLSAPAKVVGAVAVPISGKAAANAMVELWGAPMSATETELVKILETTAGADGSYKFLRWIGQGYRFAAKVGDEMSDESTVLVQHNPVFAAGSPARGKLSLAVQGNPRGPKQTVIVQRWVGGKWVNTWRGTTGTNNLWRATVNAPARSTQTLRAFVAGYMPNGVLPGYTVAKKVRVR